MLATVPEFREVDFSHLARELADVELVESVRRKPVHTQQSRLLWFALLLSLLLHLALLLFTVEANKPYSKSTSVQTLHIDLLQPPIKKRDAVSQVVTEAVVEIQSDVAPTKEVVASPVPAKAAVPAEKPREVKPVTRLVLEPLSAQELVEIFDSNQQQSDYENDPAIVRNVFHPELRKKLIAASKERRKQRIEDKEEDAGYVDPTGAYRVETDMGTCLSSPPSNTIGTPRNWYVSLCKGKTESEEMMERVNEDVNRKLRFDD